MIVLSLAGHLFKLFIDPQKPAVIVQQGIGNLKFVEQLFLDTSILCGKIDQFIEQKRLIPVISHDHRDCIDSGKAAHTNSGTCVYQIKRNIEQ